MSILLTSELECPSCGTQTSFDLVHSVNADRRPDLRAAILERSFQREACPACGHTFRVEPEFSYLDMGRGQFVAVWPSDGIDRCDELERTSRASFDRAYGAAAPPEARAIGDRLTSRVVFGWIGLNEKIVAAEAGVDDTLLELAKVALLRGTDLGVLDARRELRLLGVDGTELVLGWFHVGSEDLEEVVAVSRDVLGEIEQDAEAWGALRAELAASMFVDYRRLFLGNG